MKGLFAGLDIAIEERQKAKKVQKILAAGTIVAVGVATASVGVATVAINKNKILKDELMN